MKEVYFTQRLLAYLIDFLIVGFVSTLLITIVTLAIPADEKYDKASESFLNEYQEVLKKNDVKGFQDFFKNQKNNLYTMEKASLIVYVFDIIIYAGYFGAFQYYNGGQTLGKKVTKIKVVGNDKRNDYNYKTSLLRTAFNYGLFSKTLIIIILLICNGNNFFIPLYAVQGLAILFNFVLIIMVAFRKDGRSLSDFICRTKVVSSK